MRELDIPHFDSIYALPGKNNKNMAGIIPVIGNELESDLPLPTLYMPISKNCVAIQRSVLECARMKCSTIWVVCTRNQVPVLQKVIGNGVMEENPYKWYVLTKKGQVKDKQIPAPVVIPIYYAVVPENKGFGEKISLAKAVLWGAHTAYSSVKLMSRYMVPSRFYTTFPYSVIPYYKIPKEDIVQIKSKTKGWMMTCKGKNVRKGDLLPFIFSHAQFIHLREMYKRLSTGVIYDKKVYTQQQLKEWRKLSLKERYSDKEIDLKTLMIHFRLPPERKTEVEWYYPIQKWEDYQTYIASGVKPREIEWSPKNLFILSDLGELFLQEEEIRHPYEGLDLSNMYEDENDGLPIMDDVESESENGI